MVLVLPLLASVAVATARQEPIFYVTDEPEIRRALDVEPVEEGDQGLSLAPIERLPPDSAMALDLRSHARAWRRAVLERDVPGIVTYALPEHRGPLNDVLRDPATWQYRFVLGDWEKSIRSRLRKRNEIVLFEHTGMRSVTAYVTVCYTTVPEAALSWTVDSALREFTVSHGIPCQMFRRNDDQWLTVIESLYH